jgi:hypothetical protein
MMDARPEVRMRALLLAAVCWLSACGPNAPHRAPGVAAPRAAAAASWQQLRSADFAAYPAEAYGGPRRMPDFDGAARRFRTYRTALGEGAAQGPNFAGKYALVQIGCGAGCNQTYLIDVSTGAVAELHFADETAVEIDNRPDSALLKARWFVSPSDPQGQWTCHFENYVWRNTQLTSLGNAVAGGPCPDQ